METYIQSPAFKARIEAMMRSHHVPGMSIAIVQKDLIATASWGAASLDPPQPCTSDTLFDIASCSKSLTAASVALLVDDDEANPEVQWDSLMSELLPDDFIMPSASYTEGVTVDDVLGHRTGMSSHEFAFFGQQATQPDDARSVTRNIRNLPLAFPLRSQYLYSNLMYTVATHLVEVKSGKTFNDFLEERFFGPLSMESTSLQPAEARRKGHGHRLATGYAWDKVTASYQGFQWPSTPEAQGAGSVVSSARDLIKWVKALMRCEDPINQRVYEDLVRLRTIVEPRWKRKPKPHTTPLIYAAGLEVYHYRGKRVVSHDGGIAGFAGLIFFLPDLQFGAVIMGNAEGAHHITSLVFKELIDEVLGVSEPERPYLRSFSSAAKLSNPKAPPQKPHGPKKDRNSLRVFEAAKASFEESSESKDEKQEKGQGAPKEPRQPQKAPLSAYTGSYWHPGYRTLTVSTRDDVLFIDAKDRMTGGATLNFEHIEGESKYTAHLVFGPDRAHEAMDAEFVWEKGCVIKMGLDLEPVVKELIWFERTG